MRKTYIRYWILIVAGLLFAMPSSAQSLSVEASATASSGQFAPLWLSSNKHGVVSPYANSSYERVALAKDCDADSTQMWKWGYAIDVQLSQNAQSTLFVQQAYAELKYKKATLTIGAKERQIDLRNNELTSGGLSLGINSRPIPMAMLDIDYFRLTDWWQMRLRGGFGMTTDGAWQEDWVADKTMDRYTSNTLFHEKAFYWKFGMENKLPLTFEIGLQMMTQFGGTTYNCPSYRGVEGKVEHGEGLTDFWHALWPMGSSDASDGTVGNAAGNIVGSVNMALTWKPADDLSVKAYFERLFEDHSQLTLQYGLYDHLIGLQLERKGKAFVRRLGLEHISTKDQSGAVYHDATPSMPDMYAGVDNYYNHLNYSGWQHWGMSMGTPLLLSPIYNEKGGMRNEKGEAGNEKWKSLEFRSNRMQGWHLACGGDVSDELQWRVQMTWTRDWGTYALPLDDAVNQSHYMAEVTYSPAWLAGWSGRLAVGLSRGELIGNTTGVQMTVRKELKL